MHLRHVSVLVCVLRFYEHVMVLSRVCIIAGGNLQRAKEDSEAQLKTKLCINK